MPNVIVVTAGRDEIEETRVVNEFSTGNSDRMDFEFRAERCASCALCVDICKGDALELVDGLPERTRPADCVCCGLCEDVCPTGALGSPRWPVIEWSRCTDCSLCVDICSRQVLDLEDDDVVIASPQSCNGCGDCLEVCPLEAIRIVDEGGKIEWTRPKPNSTRIW